MTRLRRRRPVAGAGCLAAERRTQPDRRGVTLVELLVALTILGIMAGIAGPGLRAVPRSTPASPVVARIAHARTEALRTGQPVTITVVDSTTRPSHLRSATALPDGSILVDAGIDVDRFTGRRAPTHAR